MKVVAVIPAYNEQLMIPDIVKRTKKYVDEVIVVDDCSKDNTFSTALNSGAWCVLNTKNQGAGRSTQNGITYAILKFKPDIIVTLDADGQHNPDEIPWILKPVLDDEADIVVGSRFHDEKQVQMLKKEKLIHVSSIRLFFIKYGNWLFNLGCKDKLTDSQCGFRVFNRRVLGHIKITDKGFGLTIEPLIKARKLGFKVKSIPVSCIYHSEFKMNSSMNVFKQAIITLYKLIYWRMRIWA